MKSHRLLFASRRAADEFAMKWNQSRGYLAWRRTALILVAVANALAVDSCKPSTAAKSAVVNARAKHAPSDSTRMVMPFAHGVIVFVSAVNCEIDAAVAARLNAFAVETGVSVEVAFVGVPGNDTLVARKARKDLGLTVPSRVIRDGELARFKSIGIARMPMALVIKGKQLSTIISGETAPKTLGLIEAAFSPGVAR